MLCISAASAASSPQRGLGGLTCTASAALAASTASAGSAASTAPAGSAAPPVYTSFTCCWDMLGNFPSHSVYIRRMCINTILFNESRHIESIAAILASKCPTYGYRPPLCFWRLRKQKLVQKEPFWGKHVAQKRLKKGVSVLFFGACCHGSLNSLVFTVFYARVLSKHCNYQCFIGGGLKAL